MKRLVFHLFIAQCLHKCAVLLGMLLLLLPLQALSDPAETLAELAASPRWQALLHINRGATLRNRDRSYIRDSTFFLHPAGHTNTLLELEASITALGEPRSIPRCDFPARYRFLASVLGWDEPQPFAHCAEYQNWRAQMPDAGLDLVFPAAYLNSPSSMFGHTLLRLYNGRDDAIWLSQAVNFGAVTGEQDNSILYIYRGLFGGYPGRFALVPYVRKIQDYAHLENRDMWEYQLNLDQEEISWVVDHLWELRDITFDYYFLDENCAFRLLELIDVARPGTGMLESFRVTEVPVDTVRTLSDAGFMADYQYRPSKEKELDMLAGQLTWAQRRLARRLADDISLAQTEAFLGQTSEQRALIARVAYEYLRFRYRKETRDADVASRSLALLRLVHGNDTPPSRREELPVAPEAGHATQLLAVGGGEQNGESFAEILWRPAYHDWLDNPAGFLQGAQITGLQMRTRHYADTGKTRLDRLDMVNIRSLAPRTVFAKPMSWFVNGGLQRYWQVDDSLSAFVHGGPGLAWRLGAFMPYAFLAARLEHHPDADQALDPGAGGSLGVLWYHSHLQLGMDAEGYAFRDEAYRYRSRLRANVPISKNMAIRAEVRREGIRGEGWLEWQLSWRQFF